MAASCAGNCSFVYYCTMAASCAGNCSFVYYCTMAASCAGNCSFVYYRTMAASCAGNCSFVPKMARHRSPDGTFVFAHMVTLVWRRGAGASKRSGVDPPLSSSRACLHTAFIAVLCVFDIAIVRRLSVLLPSLPGLGKRLGPAGSGHYRRVQGGGGYPPSSCGVRPV